MSRKTSVTRAALCLFVAVATAPLTFSQVTITGTGAGAFKCTEGGDPLLGIALTDYVWCDSSHTFVMNNNNAADPSDLFPPGKSITSVAGLVDSQSDNSIFSSPVDGNGL